MKIRTSFVTNSSSSSFTCKICGESCCGMDLSLSEAEMHRCVNGHEVCDEHIKIEITKEIARECLKTLEFIDVKEALDSLENCEDKDEIMDLLYDEYEFRYELPEEFCPICSFKMLDPRDIVEYLEKEKRINPEEIMQELKTKFKSYSDFKKNN